MGGPENGNFPLLYVVKMSLRRWVVQKSLKTPLRRIKMAPKCISSDVSKSEELILMCADDSFITNDNLKFGAQMTI